MSETQSATVSPFEFTGGRLCLDFVNTVEGRTEDNWRECLTEYRNLVVWGQQAQILSEEQAQRLLERAQEQPAAATLALQKALEVREAIYHVFLAFTQGVTPGQADLQTVNSVLAEAMAHMGLVPTEEGFAWSWSANNDELDRVLWAAVRSVADVLVSDDVHDVRICAADKCNWLFLDTSKNHSRRWCDMKSCGNRAKVRRHHASKKSKEASSTSLPTERRG